MRSTEQAFSHLSNSEIVRLIEDYIRREDYRQILKDRMTKGRTYSQLAQTYGFSEKQIKNIVYKSEIVLANILESKVH